MQGNTHQLEYNKRPVLLSKPLLRRKYFYKNTNVFIQVNLIYQLTFGFFIMSCLCAASFLPYGRFYNRLGGNLGMLGAYIYIFMYLSFNAPRRSNFLDLLVLKVLYKTHKLRSCDDQMYRTFLKNRKQNTLRSW